MAVGVRALRARRRSGAQTATGADKFYGVINELAGSLNTIGDVTRPTDNPALAYEYRGGEAVRHETRPIKRSSLGKGKGAATDRFRIISPSVAAEGC